MEVWRIGPGGAINLAGSAFEHVHVGHVGGRPSAPDPGLGRALVELVARLAGEELAAVLHDVSDGGLGVAVAEIAIASGVGITVDYDDWRELFSEDPHRVVAVVAPELAGRLQRMAEAAGVPAIRIGTVGGDDVTFARAGTKASVEVAVAASTYHGAIPRRLR
jgi:phosphoribosylformylglycinamidine synthase subunit PurL